MESGKAIGAAMGLGARVVTIVGFAISFKLSLALLKLFQLLEFLTLFSFRYPDNVKAFLAIFNQANPMNLLPNLFSFFNLFNDHCKLPEVIFISEEIDCQILQNSGGLIGILVLGIVLKLILIPIIKLLPTKSKFNEKLSKMSQNLSDPGNIFEMMSGVHLDIYLSLMTNFQRYKKGDNVADLNLFISMISVLFLLYMLVFFLFKTSKALEADSQRKEYLKKIYKNYMYLIEGLKLDNTFSQYFNCYTITKDPIIAFSIILLHGN